MGPAPPQGPPSAEFCTAPQTKGITPRLSPRGCSPSQAEVPWAWCLGPSCIHPRNGGGGDQGHGRGDPEATLASHHVLLECGCLHSSPRRTDHCLLDSRLLQAAATRMTRLTVPARWAPLRVGRAPTAGVGRQAFTHSCDPSSCHRRNPVVRHGRGPALPQGSGLPETTEMGRGPLGVHVHGWLPRRAGAWRRTASLLLGSPLPQLMSHVSAPLRAPLQQS